MSRLKAAVPLIFQRDVCKSGGSLCICSCCLQIIQYQALSSGVGMTCVLCLHNVANVHSGKSVLIGSPIAKKNKKENG